MDLSLEYKPALNFEFERKSDQWIKEHVSTYSANYVESSAAAAKREIPPHLNEEEYIQVKMLSRDEVLNRINNILDEFMTLEQRTFNVPSRGKQNQFYSKELRRFILKKKTFRRILKKGKTAYTAVATLRALVIIKEAVQSGKHITLRELYYSGIDTFKNQESSNRIVGDICCMVGCARYCLYVKASERGKVVGNLIFKEEDDTFDCTRMGSAAKCIPANIEDLQIISCEAHFILVVEKDAAFDRLVQNRFYDKFPSIIVTGKGQPDLSTRLFIKKLIEKKYLPVFGLFDYDPYGMRIMSVYKYGSQNMSYENLAIPEIQWLGIKTQDFEKYNIRETCGVTMKAVDKDAARLLLKEKFITCNPTWKCALDDMLSNGKKYEIESFNAFGINFLIEGYLPEKLGELNLKV